MRKLLEKMGLLGYIYGISEKGPSGNYLRIAIAAATTKCSTLVIQEAQ